MNKNKTLYLVLILLLALSIQGSLHAQTSPVTVTLHAAVDKNCDGSAETANTDTALPGSCIIYTLTTVNNSTAPIYNLNINGEIPKHTRLFQQLWLDHDIFAYPQTRTDKNKSHISIRLDKLEKGEENAIVLQYAVKIEE